MHCLARAEQPGLVSNELHGLEVSCRSSEFRVFDPPAGQTCSEWAGAYVSVAGGYLADLNATSGCQYCQYSSGDGFLQTMSLEYSKRGRDIGVFTAYCIFNCIVAVIATKYLTFVYAKR
ncbi:hypothetical protein JCM6882_008659 [Rhodosporidiobolus microsporus]